MSFDPVARQLAENAVAFSTQALAVAELALAHAGGDGGGAAFQVATVSQSYAETTSIGEKIVIVALPITITLPNATANAAKLTFKFVSPAGSMTLAAAYGQAIDGGASTATSVQYTAITIVSDGANWMVI